MFGVTKTASIVGGLKGQGTPTKIDRDQMPKNLGIPETFISY